jgi:small nuclear ribonucleoprotein (snRNP)-like protein
MWLRKAVQNLVFSAVFSNHKNPLSILLTHLSSVLFPRFPLRKVDPIIMLVPSELLDQCKGERLHIELKQPNGMELEGTLLMSDESCNMVLTDVVYYQRVVTPASNDESELAPDNGEEKKQRIGEATLVATKKVSRVMLHGHYISLIVPGGGIATVG